MHFPISGIDAPLWLPPLVALGISFFTSMGGVSGAFLILPFQVSILNYVGPSVSATNHIYNIVATPGGIYRYIRQGSMVWRLFAATVFGTLPGVIAGAWIRVAWLPDPRKFKVFAGVLLLYLGFRMVLDLVRPVRAGEAPAAAPPGPTRRATWLPGGNATYCFQGRTYPFPSRGVFLLCLIVGMAGGIYGIGGGAIIAPFFVSILGIPVRAAAGPALAGTFVTSTVGVACYHILAPYYPHQSVAPDWLLGLSFGLGGLVGTYLGARCQKHMPTKVIKGILTVCVLFVAISYVTAIFGRR